MSCVLDVNVHMDIYRITQVLVVANCQSFAASSFGRCSSLLFATATLISLLCLGNCGLNCFKALFCLECHITFQVLNKDTSCIHRQGMCSTNAREVFVKTAFDQISTLDCSIVFQVGMGTECVWLVLEWSVAQWCYFLNGMRESVITPEFFVDPHLSFLHSALDARVFLFTSIWQQAKWHE